MSNFFNVHKSMACDNGSDSVEETRRSQGKVGEELDHTFRATDSYVQNMAKASGKSSLSQGRECGEHPARLKKVTVTVSISRLALRLIPVYAPYSWRREERRGRRAVRKPSSSHADGAGLTARRRRNQGPQQLRHGTVTLVDRPGSGAQARGAGGAQPPREGGAERGRSSEQVSDERSSTPVQGVGPRTRTRAAQYRWCAL